MHAHIRHPLEPELSLVIKIRIVQERAAVDEIAPEIADRALDFAFRLRAIGTTGAWREAPVMREAKKLRIAHERAAFQPQVSCDHGLHLIEEQLLWHAAEIAKGVLEARDQRRQILARIEPTPQKP